VPDPYLPPTAPIDAPLPATPQCPKCGEASSTKVGFNWWGGALGPKLFHVVRCNRCRAQYNGRTGGSLTKVIIVYQLVAVVVFGALAYLSWDAVAGALNLRR
jgi:hypothetical protein